MSQQDLNEVLGPGGLKPLLSQLGLHERLEVRDAGDGKGKGIFARTGIRKGDVVFVEPALVRGMARCAAGRATVVSWASQGCTMPSCPAV